jgi:serine/threonine-protein kinase
MVGRRNPASLLQCNTYLRSFDTGRAPVNVCLDPGSRFDFESIQANLVQLVGDLGDIHSFSLNHQDPDVVGNALHLCEANPNMSAMMTEEVWRLVQHLNFQPRRLHLVSTSRSPLVSIADQHRWQLVPTPFCHFRGAMAFYDPELRTLFSGDLFGGLNRLGRVQLLAEESDWAGIAQFHQIYMPSRDIVRHTLRQILALKPAVEVIAPQHGFVVTGDLVPLFLERMHELLVGHDLLAAELDEGFLDGYRQVLDRLLGRASETMGQAEVISRLKTAEVDDGLDRLVSVRGPDVRLQREGYSAVVKILDRLTEGEMPEVANALRSEVLAACLDYGLPIPAVGAGVEGDWFNSSIGSDGISIRSSRRT